MSIQIAATTPLITPTSNVLGNRIRDVRKAATDTAKLAMAVTAASAGAASPLTSTKGRSSPKKLPTQPARESIEPATRALDVTRDGRYLVAATENRSIYMWRIRDDEQPEQSLSSVIDSRIRDVAFSPDGSRVAVGTADASVHVWQWRDGREIAVLHRHGDVVNAVELAGDNTHLFSTGDDSTVAVYPCTTCKPFEQVLRDAQRTERING